MFLKIIWFFLRIRIDLYIKRCIYNVTRTPDRYFYECSKDEINRRKLNKVLISFVRYSFYFTIAFTRLYLKVNMKYIQVSATSNFVGKVFRGMTIWTLCNDSTDVNGDDGMRRMWIFHNVGPCCVCLFHLPDKCQLVGFFKRDNLYPLLPALCEGSAYKYLVCHRCLMNV